MAYYKAHEATASGVATATGGAADTFGIFSAVRKLMRAFFTWRAYSGTVRSLSDLSDDTLKDIGVERSNIPWVAKNSVAAIRWYAHS